MKIVKEKDAQKSEYASTSTVLDYSMVIYIDKKEIYYWNGNFKLAIICTPAWTKDQCKLIDK